jgi:hypothetical protein
MVGLGLEFGTRIIGIVEAVVGLPGSNLRLGVVAEDVTGRPDYDLLGRIGCDLALGALKFHL